MAEYQVLGSHFFALRIPDMVVHFQHWVFLEEKVKARLMFLLSYTGLVFLNGCACRRFHSFLSLEIFLVASLDIGCFRSLSWDFLYHSICGFRSVFASESFLLLHLLVFLYIFVHISNSLHYSRTIVMFYPSLASKSSICSCNHLCIFVSFHVILSNFLRCVPCVSVCFLKLALFYCCCSVL